MNVDITELFPPELGLTRKETMLLDLLMRREMVSDQAFYMVCYQREPPTYTRMLNVTVTRLRHKLRPHGIAIKSRHGVGCFIPRADKTKLRELCARIREET